MSEKNYKFGLCKECYECRLKKYVYSVDLPYQEKEEYVKRQLDKIENAPKDMNSTDFKNMLKEEYHKFFIPKDFSVIKHQYNQKIMNMLSSFEGKLQSIDDPLLYALKLSLIGNYIDFDMFDEIDDGRLINMLNDAENKDVDLNAYHILCDELSKASSLVYFTDNCGEVVLDRLFIKEIKKRYPNINITAMVRYKDAINDACLIDAKEVKLDEVCTVIDNGLIGTKLDLDKLSEERKSLVMKADLIISKGQANAESLAGCGLNIYYIFLCKCNYFASNYHAKMFDGILCKERK